MDDNAYPYGFELCYQCNSLPGLKQRRKGKVYQFQFLCSGRGCGCRKPYATWYATPGYAKIEWNKQHRDMKAYLAEKKAEAANA